MAMLICPTCELAFDTETSLALPFCSSRCREIDLGRWMNEEYGLPIEDGDELSEFENDSA
ncbi:MAG: DNA gyrase inhibitor YacG [Planctomycetota bacterium]|nr:MAG: DNA gyrase inhibitor YacG [Planctomycetota bacterium]REJ88974.1 MAG: DNA gyrase inhibitor YacG [Planctomycetota bacterium]REK31222.1 MAG: DNA gyrase inhibitor YacG [Planctomycetota bacterium]REK43560.1 MAG: DNA gyrase inhibitor YacG [Planctomycetota bacterium]